MKNGSGGVISGDFNFRGEVFIKGGSVGTDEEYGADECGTILRESEEVVGESEVFKGEDDEGGEGFCSDIRINEVVVGRKESLKRGEKGVRTEAKVLVGCTEVGERDVIGVTDEISFAGWGKKENGR